MPAPADVAGRHAKQTRPRTIPLPTAFTAAIIAGLFGMLYLGFDSLNGAIADLRDDMDTQIGRLDAKIDTKIDELRTDMDTHIGTLRSDMNTQIGRLDAKIDTKIDELRSEFSAILLDHTDRLARIETHLEIIRQPEDPENAAPAQ